MMTHSVALAPHHGGMPPFQLGLCFEAGPRILFADGR